MITLYGFGRVTAFAHGRTRDLRALWALEEMALPYRVVRLDHPTGELGTPAFQAISPFQQIPAIADDEVTVSESGAILLYLARKSGRLMPPDAAGQDQVMRWCFAALNTVELPMTILDVLAIAAQGGTAVPPPLRDQTLALAHTRLRSLEQWLQGREYIATAEFTVADILMAHVVSEIDDAAMYEPYPGVRAYRARCQGRPAWHRALASYCANVESA